MSADEGVAVPFGRANNDLIARCAYPSTPADKSSRAFMLPHRSADMYRAGLPSCAAASSSGFTGCNLNPDPRRATSAHPPLTDAFWFRLYEAMVELDVPRYPPEVA
jgi:4-oxalmesaconate hydratase